MDFEIIVSVVIMSIFSNEKILLSVMIVFELIKLMNLKCMCEFSLAYFVCVCVSLSLSFSFSLALSHAVSRSERNMSELLDNSVSPWEDSRAEDELSPEEIQMVWRPVQQHCIHCPTTEPLQ